MVQGKNERKIEQRCSVGQGHFWQGCKGNALNEAHLHCHRLWPLQGWKFNFKKKSLPLKLPISSIFLTQFLIHSSTDLSPAQSWSRWQQRESSSQSSLTPSSPSTPRL